MSLPRCSILEVTPEHRDWPEYVAAINGEGQKRWAFDVHFEPFPRHFVMAKQDGHVVGFLMYVVWEIGPNDRSHRPLVVDGRPLTEAKIIAFGVKQAYRRQGIGRALQKHTLRRAKALGCYQVRSVSDRDHPENHQLKLAMGFAVEPLERDKLALAFIMPLKPNVADAQAPNGPVTPTGERHPVGDPTLSRGGRDGRHGHVSADPIRCHHHRLLAPVELVADGLRSPFRHRTTYSVVQVCAATAAWNARSSVLGPESPRLW